MSKFGLREIKYENSGFWSNRRYWKNVVRFALHKNYYVNAYVRDPKKMDIRDEKLTVYQGMVNDYSVMKDAMSQNIEWK